jgi:hypothetical protein
VSYTRRQGVPVPQALRACQSRRIPGRAVETVVAFLEVSRVGEGEVFFFVLDFGVVVDKLRAVITVELPNQERDGNSYVSEDLKCPGMGVIAGGSKFQLVRRHQLRSTYVPRCRKGLVRNSESCRFARNRTFFVLPVPVDQDFPDRLTA